MFLCVRFQGFCKSYLNLKPNHTYYHEKKKSHKKLRMSLSLLVVETNLLGKSITDWMAPVFAAQMSIMKHWPVLLGTIIRTLQKNVIKIVEMAHVFTAVACAHHLCIDLSWGHPFSWWTLMVMCWVFSLGQQVFYMCMCHGRWGLSEKKRTNTVTKK